MSEFDRGSSGDRLTVYTEEQYRQAMERLKDGLHPFREYKINKDTGEEVERVKDYREIDSNNSPHVILLYTLNKKMGGRWLPYDKVAHFEKPVFNPRIKTKMVNAYFPYGLVDDVLRVTDTSRPVVEYYKEFLQDPCSCFTVSGRTGAGKTYGAVWLVSEMIRQRKVDKIGFLKASDLDGYLKSGNTDNLPIVPSRDVELLVLDDVCAEIVTSVIRDQATRLLDYRLNRKLWTIITTNMGIGAIQDQYGERFVSRLARNDARYVSLEDPEEEQRKREEILSLPYLDGPDDGLEEIEFRFEN